MGDVQGQEGGVGDGLHPVPRQHQGYQGAALQAAHGAPGAPLPRAAAQVPGANALWVPAPRAVAAQP